MIREVDARTASDEVLREFAAIEHACAPELHPGEPPRLEEEIVAFLRHQPTTHASCHWLAAGGYASLYVHGPRAAFVDLLVRPDARRAGLGTALLEEAVRRARELSAVSLFGGHATGAGAAFARSHGAVDGQRVVRSLLHLREAELPELRLPAGWSAVTWLVRVPDEHLEAYVRARAAMDDAPADEEMEYPIWDAETVRASEESLRSREREMRLTVALRDDGEIGAFTELRVSGGSTSAFTDDTGTAAEHRRQGLAGAVKLESLRRLRDDHPEVEVVTTSNAEENSAMRHINESIGFRPTVTTVSSALSL